MDVPTVLGGPGVRVAATVGPAVETNDRQAAPPVDAEAKGDSQAIVGPGVDPQIDGLRVRTSPICQKKSRPGNSIPQFGGIC